MHRRDIYPRDMDSKLYPVTPSKEEMTQRTKRGRRTTEKACEINIIGNSKVLSGEQKKYDRFLVFMEMKENPDSPSLDHSSLLAFK